MDLNYLRVWTELQLAKVRRDDRGMAAEFIVIIGMSLVGSAVVGGILWAKLKGAAQIVNTPPTTVP